MSDVELSLCTGLEALARELGRGVEHFAVVGGEGARRLGASLEGALPQLGDEGVAGAMAALGAAAAGARVALLASGDAVSACVPVLRQALALGVPLLLVCPSHGEDRGATLPAPTHEDLRALFSLPMPLWLASRPAAVPGALRAALHAMDASGRPAVLACALGAVGLRTELVRFEPGLEPALRFYGPDDDELLLVAAGAAAESARATKLAMCALSRVKPRPWSALLPRLRAARAVLVHEPWPEPDEPGLCTSGALSASLRAELAGEPDAPRVYTLFDEEPSPATWLGAVATLRGEPSTPAPTHPLVAAPHETRIELRASPERLYALVPALLQRAIDAGFEQSYALPTSPTNALVVLPTGARAQWLWLGEGGTWEPGSLAALPAETTVLTVGAAPGALVHAVALRNGALRHVHRAHEGADAALAALLGAALASTPWPQP